MTKTAEYPTEQIDDLINDLQSDAPLSASLNDADGALISYALELTHSPANITGRHIDELRQHGFDDRAIHDLACCVAYFAFVNRIADGLGVQLESR